MKYRTKPDGGIQVELEAAEVKIFRHLVERAAFIDTPPQEQADILRLADQFLVALARSGDSPAR